MATKKKKETKKKPKPTERVPKRKPGESMPDWYKRIKPAPKKKKRKTRRK